MMSKDIIAAAIKDMDAANLRCHMHDIMNDAWERNRESFSIALELLDLINEILVGGDFNQWAIETKFSKESNFCNFEEWESKARTLVQKVNGCANEEKETAQADSSLIAAAPELLAIAECDQALEDFTFDGAFDVFKKHGYPGPHLFVPAADWLSNKRKSAIAKATGAPCKS